MSDQILNGKRCPSCGLVCHCTPAYQHDVCKGCSSPYPEAAEADIGGEA